MRPARAFRCFAAIALGGWGCISACATTQTSATFGSKEAADAGPESFDGGSGAVADDESPRPMAAVFASDLPDAPPGSTGVCRVPPNADAGYPESPIAVANCPDVYDLVRGDGIDIAGALPPVVPGPMPDWDLDALRDYACAYACAPTGSSAYLLAWSVVEDRRPLRNHKALFAIEHAAPSGESKWSVVVMYRHATNTWWNIDTGGFHRRRAPVRHFARRPTGSEIMTTLRVNDWQLTEEKGGFRLLAGNLIGPLWRVVTNEPPPR